MTPALFAMVDAVLRHRVKRARQACGVSAETERLWMRRRSFLGWWRSTW